MSLVHTFSHSVLKKKKKLTTNGTLSLKSSKKSRVFKTLVKIVGSFLWTLWGQILSHHYTWTAISEMIRSKQVWTNPLFPPQPSPHFFPSLISMAQPMNFRSIYSVIQVLLLPCYITPKSLSLIFLFLQWPKCITQKAVKWSEIMWVNSLAPGL